MLLLCLSVVVVSDFIVVFVVVVSDVVVVSSCRCFKSVHDVAVFCSLSAHASKSFE
jgi:hypothetical protein